MSRADDLHRRAEDQVAALIAVIEAAGEGALRRPCPGREKLGDGTVGAIAAHTAANYARIAGFATGAGPDTASAGHGPSQAGAAASREALVSRLRGVRGSLRVIAELDDARLDVVPPAESFRFCDGARTVEQVLTALLRHQEHQVQAIAAALG